MKVNGVESVEFAPVGANGTFPTTGWVRIVGIEDGSLSITIPELQKNKIFVEDVPGPWGILGTESDGATVTGKALNLDPKYADLLFKGNTASILTNKFEAPTDGTNIVRLALRITSKPYEGYKAVFGFIDTAVTPRIENPLTKTGFLAIGFTSEAMTPLDSNSLPVSPWFYEKVSAVTT